MVNPYGPLLRLPGTLRFVVAGFVGRLPLSMVGLGTLLLVSESTGSYGLAGGVSATLAGAGSVVGPQIGRLFDRFGQQRVLPPVLAVHASGIVGLIVSAQLGAPSGVLFACAFVAGACYPAIGSLVRARWTHLLRGTPSLQTAFALESVLDDVIFTLGPTVVTILATTISPVTGLLTALGLVVAGGLSLAAQRATEPPLEAHRRRGGAAIRLVGMRVLVVVFLMIGTLFGSLDVAMVAFAAQHGSPAAAGPLLGLFALGSAVAGVAFGARAWDGPPQRRLLTALTILALGMVPVSLAGGIGPMIPAVLLGGCAIAPALITGFALVEALVPPAALTEGFTWLSTSIAGGVAVGLLVGGHVVDVTSGRTALIVSLVAALLAMLAAAGGRRQLAAAS